MRLITSFFIFVFILVSFQYAIAASIPNPPQYLLKREVVISVVSVVITSPPPSDTIYNLLQMGLGSNNQTFKECRSLLAVLPCKNTWELGANENFTYNPLTFKLDRPGVSGENLTTTSVMLSGVVSTTNKISDFTQTVEFHNLRMVITVNMTHTTLDCADRKINFSDSSSLITGRTNESFCFSTFEDPAETNCYQQMNPSTGFLKNTCGDTCGKDLNITQLNETSDPKICMMSRCNNRHTDIGIPNVCGPACYEQINITTGKGTGRCDLTCPDARTQQNALTGKCEMITCGSRKPTTESKLPCGRDCFKQINSATGAEEAICRSNCPDDKLTRENPTTYKCVMKTCATRTPNVDIPNSCGALCELASNLTCQGIGGSDVDDDGDGGEEGETPVVAAPEVVQEADPLKFFKTATAITLPIVGVITVAIIVVCIVLVVLNAPKEEKKTGADTRVEDGEIPVFPWKGRDPAPAASPAPSNTAGADTAVSSTPTTVERTTPADTTTATAPADTSAAFADVLPTPAGSPEAPREKRKSTKTKSVRRKTKRLADQEDD